MISKYDVGRSGSQGQDSPNQKQNQIPAAAGQTGSQVPPPAPSGPQRPQKTASASQVLRVPQGFPLQGLYPRLSQDTPLYCLDLEQYANGRLDRAWQYPVHTVSLRDLEPGLRVFNGTELDVRSVIQLRASNALTNYHSEVNGITIDQEAVRVHFLHGTGGVVPDGDPIGSYILRFSDGGETEVPIVYGEHVREWHARSDITSPITAGKLAWSFSSCHQTRLYHQTWTNGTPARRLQSVRFVSGLTACSPFLVAITFDPPDRARSQVEMILRQHEREE